MPEPKADTLVNSSDEATYDRILQSSAIIGGSSLLSIAISIVRTKFIAVLLGPSAFGLFGIYGSISTLFQSLAGFGVCSSGVRQIAHAARSNDPARIAITSNVIRRASLLLGTLGAILLVTLAKPISVLTFGNDLHSRAILLLSIVVVLQILSNGQIALIQGMRQIVRFAKVGVFGALAATIITLPLIYFLREKGIVLSLIGISLSSLFFSWLFSREIGLGKGRMTRSQAWRETSTLLSIGFAFMVAVFINTGTSYTVKIILLRSISVEATGLYQAAWTLGGVYVGFILQAMGADFYPRLTGNIDDIPTFNRLINEQIYVGLLLACPCVLLSLLLAPVVITLLYSSKFLSAIWILRWISVGTILQVTTWPMSYAIIAKAKQDIYLFIEVIWGISNVILTLLFVRSYGVTGAGVAFFLSYVAYCGVLIPVVSVLSGFRISKLNLNAACFCSGVVLAAMLSLALLRTELSSFVVTALTFFSILYTVRRLVELISLDRLPKLVRSIVVRIKFLVTANS